MIDRRPDREPTAYDDDYTDIPSSGAGPKWVLPRDVGKSFRLIRGGFGHIGPGTVEPRFSTVKACRKVSVPPVFRANFVGDYRQNVHCHASWQRPLIHLPP